MMQTATAHTARLQDIEDFADPGAAVVRLVIIETQGSAPREAGAAMLVAEGRETGTIGGGRLEFDALAHARALLRKDQADTLQRTWNRDVRQWVLGPGLGQCCGGAVRVLFEVYGAAERAQLRQQLAEVGPNAHALAMHPAQAGTPVAVLTDRKAARDLPLPLARFVGDQLSGAKPFAAQLVQGGAGRADVFIAPLRPARTPLFVYGAGHVGRALIKAAADLDFDLHWVDTAADRFPVRDVGPNATRAIARQPEGLAAAAPGGAFHIVLTYSHEIDLAICRAVLAADKFAFLGLIGSKSKRARFAKRLSEGGIPHATLARLTCPVGLGGHRNKAPAAIAVSIAAQLIDEQQRLAMGHGQHSEGADGTSQSIPSSA